MLVTQSWATLCDPTDCSLLGSSSMEFSRQGYWTELPFPSPGVLPDPEIELRSLTSPSLQADSLPTELPGKPRDLIISKFVKTYLCLYLSM